MVSQNIIADLNKGEKLNSELWHLVSQDSYLLDEKEVLKILTQSMEAPLEEGNSTQHRRDVETYAQ